MQKAGKRQEIANAPDEYEVITFTNTQSDMEGRLYRRTATDVQPDDNCCTTTSSVNRPDREHRCRGQSDARSCKIAVTFSIVPAEAGDYVAVHLTACSDRENVGQNCASFGIGDAVGPQDPELSSAESTMGLTMTLMT
jgi:hypothetical protein